MNLKFSFSCPVSPQDPSLLVLHGDTNPQHFHFCALRTFLDLKSAFCASWISIISIVQHLCALATSHFQHFFAFGNPKFVAAWKWDHSSFWRFFPCLEVISGQLRPIPVVSPIRLWSCWFFPCFVGILAVYGSCPNSPFVLFDPHHGIMTLSTQQKHYVLKGWCPISPENTIKFWKKTPKDNWFHFRTCTSAPGTNTTQKKTQVCHVRLWNPSCATGRLGFAAHQLPKTCNSCWCAIDVGESSVQFLRN